MTPTTGTPPAGGRQSAPAPSMQQVISPDGTPIGYWQSGAGPPLLLVHGTTADHTRWVKVTSAMESSFTVYAMDRRGRGESGDANPYALEREFEDIAAVIDAVGGAVDVIGHSYGALCCLEAARLTPNVRRLILYEPPIPTPSYPDVSEIIGRMQELIDQGEREAALEIFFREVVKMPEHELAVYRTLPAWQVRIGLVSTVPREDAAEQSYRFAPERFADFRVPTLLLLGGDSPPAFREPIEVLNAALPDSRVVILPGQQHVAMDTAPELFLEEVRRFLQD